MEQNVLKNDGYETFNQNKIPGMKRSTRMKFRVWNVQPEYNSGYDSYYQLNYEFCNRSNVR